MTVINLEALYYTFGTSGINYEVASNFKVSLGEKRESNLKLLKDKTLEGNNFFLLTFVLFFIGIALFLKIACRVRVAYLKE